MSTNHDLERAGINIAAQTPAVAASLTFISEHYLEPLTADKIAAAGGHATRTMQEAFQRDLDRTATNIILELRLRAARDILLHSQGPIVIKDVAARVGWAHPAASPSATASSSAKRQGRHFEPAHGSADRGDAESLIRHPAPPQRTQPLARC
ncbi:hypothetical protein P9139_00500 [Curtobacterium flaccumfaciens]|nr:hypothetical protein P9139_00500 [Curtobacterium flaccumfaciens]